MITCAQFLAGSEVRFTHGVLLKNHISAFGHEQGNQKITAIIAISQYHVAGFKAAREWATILFVLVRSEIDVIANEIGKLRVIIDGPVLDQAPVSVARRRSVPPALTLDRLA